MALSFFERKGTVMTNKSSKIAPSEIAAIAHKRKNVASSKTLAGLRYVSLSGFCLMLTIYFASGVVFAAEI